MARTSARWTEVLKEALLNVLLEVQANGIFMDACYRREEWTFIVRSFAERTGVQYSQQQISSYICSMKSDWNFYRKISGISDFGWNESCKSVHDADERWEELINETKEGKRYKSMRYGLSYTGSYSRGG